MFSLRLNKNIEFSLIRFNKKLLIDFDCIQQKSQGKINHSHPWHVSSTRHYYRKTATLIISI
jgi:hypothetical protein